MNYNCLIYNYAQHYRAGIFKLMDKNLKTDFYFGDKINEIKKLDYNELNNFKKELKNIKLYRSIYWQRGAVELLFKDYKNYILLGEYYCISNWFILILAKFTKKKVYSWTHGCYGNEGFLKRIIKKIFFEMSDGLFLYGNYAKKMMIRDGYNQKNLHVIYNSLDYKKQLKIRNKLVLSSIFRDKFENDDPVLIFIGRLTKTKKLEYLISAQHNLLNKDFPVNIIFVGDGNEKSNLISKSIEFSLQKRIWFYGPSYDEEEIGNLIFNSNICVSPGNIGLTAIHSLTFGTPVITHDNFANQMPEFEAIKDGITGAFFKENDIEDLAKKIKWWLLHKDKNIVKNECFKVIDRFFNPNFQLAVIKKIINEK